MKRNHAAKSTVAKSIRYWGKRKPRKRRRGPPTITTMQFHFMLEAHLHGLEARRCPAHIRERLTDRKIWEESSPTRINPVPTLVLTKRGLDELFRGRPDLRWG